MERIYIGMGSNLAAPEQQLRNAIEALAQLPGTTVAGVSAFYQSDSLLPGQPRYTNAVAALDSDLAPLALLDALQAIENDQGRDRIGIARLTGEQGVTLIEVGHTDEGGAWQ